MLTENILTVRNFFFILLHIEFEAIHHACSHRTMTNLSDDHSNCCTTVKDVLTHTLVNALEEKEAMLDEQIKYYDTLNEDDVEEIRRKRLEEMKESSAKFKTFISQGHGKYDDLLSERDFFEAAKKSKNFVCHFYRPSTWRCQIVDRHLDILARKHIGTRFVKLNVEKSPYLAEKMRIMMLPTIMLINDGKTDHSIIGFDEMGGTDDFETDDLEQVLVNWKIITRKQ